jgi:hypothetical protein
MRGMLERSGFVALDSTPDATRFVLDRRSNRSQRSAG